MNTSMRGFIAPYVPSKGRGSGLLYVTSKSKRNTRLLDEQDRKLLHRYVFFTFSLTTSYTIGTPVSWVEITTK
jgi:hypothetical protein